MQMFAKIKRLWWLWRETRDVEDIEQRKLWQTLNDLEFKIKRQVTPEKIRLAWLELSNNQVVMEDLKERVKMNGMEIQKLLLLDQDRRDIEKAKIMGKIDILMDIINKAYLFKN